MLVLRHGEWLGDILYYQQKNKPSKYWRHDVTFHVVITNKEYNKNVPLDNFHKNLYMFFKGGYQ